MKMSKVFLSSIFLLMTVNIFSQSKINEVLQNQILSDYQNVRDCLQDTYHGNKTKMFSQFKVKNIDLNKDGQMEYLVEAYDYDSLGDNGCFGDWRGNHDIWVYGKTTNGFNQLLNAIFSEVLKPLKSSTNSFLDLADTGHNGVMALETIYKFDGEKYRSAECLTYEFDQTRRGGLKLVSRDDCSGNAIIEPSPKSNNSEDAQSQNRENLAKNLWQPFWTKFVSAVNRKDLKVILQLSSTKDFNEFGESTKSDWFRALPKKWSLMSKAVLSGTQKFNNSLLIERITKKHWDLIFRFENNDEWRFIGELVEPD